MISAGDFASRYTSFWHQCLPWCEEAVGAINNRLQNEFAGPRPDRGVNQDIVGDLGLRWFAAHVRDGRILESPPGQEVLERVVSESAAFVARLRRVPTERSLDKDEIGDAQGDAAAIQYFLKKYEIGETIVPYPLFCGCGILSECSGDLLVGTTLYEMKATKDGFRQPNLRQLIVYCALNYAAPRHEIRRVGLINPRRGTFFRSDLSTLVTNLCGQSPATLYHEIIDFVCTQRVSA